MRTPRGRTPGAGQFAAENSRKAQVLNCGSKEGGWLRSSGWQLGSQAQSSHMVARRLSLSPSDKRGKSTSWNETLHVGMGDHSGYKEAEQGSSRRFCASPAPPLPWILGLKTSPGNLTNPREKMRRSGHPGSPVKQPNPLIPCGMPGGLQAQTLPTWSCCQWPIFNRRPAEDCQTPRKLQV